MNQAVKNDSMMETAHMSQCYSTGKFFSHNIKRSHKTKRSKPNSKQLPQWNQSSSTWRHTSYRYSIPKSKRQKPKQLYYSEIYSPEVKSTRAQKTCSLGRGKRQPISQIILKNARQKPSPTAYNKSFFDESPRNPQKGKSLGIGWSNYQKNYADHRKDAYAPHFVKDNPPAIYNVRQSPGKDKKSCALHGRQKMFSQKMSEITKDIPGPIYDIKDRHLYGTVGLNQRNFGFGDRIDFSAPANDNPGAKYHIGGFCDKFANLSPSKNNQMK